MSEFVEIRRNVCAKSRKWRAGVVVDMLDVDILVSCPLCSARVVGLVVCHSF